MISLVYKREMEAIVANDTSENKAFAEEAFRYNTEIDNWDNPVICYYDGDKFGGALYWRPIDDNLSQLVNVYSNLKGAGTEMLEHLMGLISTDYCYFYMTPLSKGFYNKRGIQSMNEGDFQFTMIDKNFKNVNPKEYQEFIQKKLRKL